MVPTTEQREIRQRGRPTVRPVAEVMPLGEAKAAADRARSGAAKLAFWMTAALLFGAFAASLAAVEGGQLRDGTWQERRLIPRPW